MLEQTDREQVAVDVDQANELIQHKEDVFLLSEFPAFRRIIENGYFQQEAVRLVSLLGDPGMQEATQQKGIMDDMRAISSLQYYLRDIINTGQSAEASLISYKKEQEMIETEEEETDYV